MSPATKAPVGVLTDANSKVVDLFYLRGVAVEDRAAASGWRLSWAGCSLAACPELRFSVGCAVTSGTSWTGCFVASFTQKTHAVICSAKASHTNNQSLERGRRPFLLASSRCEFVEVLVLGAGGCEAVEIMSFYSSSSFSRRGSGPRNSISRFWIRRPWASRVVTVTLKGPV